MLSSMSSWNEDLSRALNGFGYQFRMVAIEHLSELETEIHQRMARAEFDKDFYGERLSWFKFHPPESLKNPLSLIVVALPRPQTQATFTWKGKRKSLYLPPTYTAYDRITKEVENHVADVISEWGYHIASTALPLKLLAARSGLTQYGRNNICYVPAMGSYLQLVAAYSDMPCQSDTWQESAMMSACESCERCVKACPTRAIPTDRFLLHAERCIVFHNERPGDVPFPEWMNPSWHNCVVGCFRCQRVCPVDKEFLKFTGEQEEFSEEETSLFLQGTDMDSLPKETLAKLQRLSLDEYLGVLPRNLGVFFRK